MTGYFNTFDYVFMCLYFIVLVAMGLYLKSRASESIEDYIVGGNKLPWWAIGISGMANFMDLTGTAVIVSFLFLLGPRGLFIEFRGGACLIMAFMMLWTGKWHRRSKCLTGAEWNIFRFGDTWGGRFAQLSAVIAQILGTVGMVSYLIFGVGQFLSMFLPFPPMTCALILVGVATVYTMVSGFYGVVFTDIFQSGIIIVATLYICTIAFMKVGSAGELQNLALEVTGNHEWMSASAQWNTNMPEGYTAYQHLALFAFFYLLRNIFQGAGSGADPKYFGARNDRECGTLSFLWTSLMTVRWPLMMGIAVLGIYLVASLFPELAAVKDAVELIRQHYPDVTQSGWGGLVSNIANTPDTFPAELIAGLKALLGPEDFADKVKLLGFSGTVNPERILPSVLILCTIPGLRGLVLIALIAASMSTFDSNINLASGLMVRDLYQKYIRPKASNKELVYAGWVSVVLLVLGGFGFAASVKSINDIWSWIIMGFGAGLLAPGILRFYWWRFNGGGYAVGTLCGMLSAVFQRIVDPGMEKLWFFRIAPQYNELILFVFVFMIGTLGCVIGSFIMKQTDPAVLEDFYRKTRPFGLWKKMKDLLPADERGLVTQEHRNDLIALPFALLWQVSMFMMPMLLITHSWGSFFKWGVAFAIGLYGVYRFWYRHLPKTNNYES
ncbi:sodium:solute symporter family transporter [Tichowtungia aerotolerans]|uniref:Sodium:solute symporter n=1 Tax=Tichowtungia aerotolerans TaxID=2697043 RepID=A0A6P1M7T0_9BACT|nr:sodium:solute symporter [Tichowtungia aerotolerans]QHI69931.1 sodium:solute symporter [Tichowtungia aerotolerans]